MPPRRGLGLTLLLTLAAGGVCRGAATESTLFRRVIPTDVTWGEISLAEGGAAKVTVRNDHVDFPLTLAIVCDERERREDPGDAASEATAKPSRRRGAVYLAAEVAGGRGAWGGAIAQLRERLARLTPETFGTFARTFTRTLTGPDGLLEGGFRAVACLTVDGESDQSWEVRRAVDDGRVSVDKTGFPDSRPICSALTAALEGEAPESVQASRFEVRTQRTQELFYSGLPTSGSARAPWPPGAGVTVAPPPPGATAYASSGTENGVARAEELRAAGNQSLLLKATAQSAAIPADILDDDAFLARWRWRVEDATLGVDPTVTPAGEAYLFVAFVFPEAHGRLASDEMAHSVARDFGASDQPPGVALVQSLLGRRGHEIGTDRMFAVYCDSTKPHEATYCVAHACAPVENADEFCDALAVKFHALARGAR